MPEESRIVHPDDTLFSEVLSRAVREDGAVSYSTLRGDTALTDYLTEVALARPEIFPSRLQQLAFWLNAHNAYALDMLRSNGTIRSIDELGGFKSAKVAIIAGERHSLSDIEDYLSRSYREPRAFFALFDGSKTSPKLSQTPFMEATLSDQLDRQVREYLADTTKNYLDKKTNTIYLSPIFHQYAEELEKPAGSLLAFVRAFAPPEMAQWIDAHPLVRLAYLRYDYTVFTSDVETHQPTPEQHEQQHPRERRRTESHKPSGGIR